MQHGRRWRRSTSCSRSPSWPASGRAPATRRAAGARRTRRGAGRGHGGAAAGCPVLAARAEAAWFAGSVEAVQLEAERVWRSVGEADSSEWWRGAVARGCRRTSTRAAWRRRSRSSGPAGGSRRAATWDDSAPPFEAALALARSGDGAAPRTAVELVRGDRRTSRARRGRVPCSRAPGPAAAAAAAPGHPRAPGRPDGAAGRGARPAPRGPHRRRDRGPPGAVAPHGRAPRRRGAGQARRGVAPCRRARSSAAGCPRSELAPELGTSARADG